jgi:single-strand DNA-binding protein
MIMFDTYVTVVGNVLTAPEWRRTTNTGTLVASFRIASTARRFDRDNNGWVDGNSLRLRVTCWRRLAEGVASSVMTGDPIVVVGRMFSRDWADAEGNNRTSYELEAVAVGHDLSRGKARFARTRSTGATSELDDDEAMRARGEATEEVADGDMPASYGDSDHLFDDGPAFGDLPDARAADPAGESETTTKKSDVPADDREAVSV